MFALSTAVCVLGLWGLFMGRAFGPLALLALAARLVLREPSLQSVDLGAYLRIAGLDLLPLAPLAKDARPWFLGDDFILSVGGLALFEFFCHRVVALRTGLRHVDGLLRAAAAVVAALGLGIARDGSALDAMLGKSATLTLQSQPWLQGKLQPALVGSAVALGVLVLGRLRRKALGRVAEQERGDPLGVGWLAAWTEDLWTVLWPPLFVLLPPTGVLALIIGLITLLRLRAALRFSDEDDKVICVCGQYNYRTAPRCAGCGGRNASPVAVGRMGQPLDDFATDLDAHARALYEVRRCPRCACPLDARAPQQFCTACGQAAPPDALFVSEYDRAIRARTAGTLFGTALWGAVPLVGLVPAIFFAHRRLIAPYARYVKRLNIALQAVLALFWLAVIVTQLVPGVGAVGLPLMAYASHRAQRGAYLKGNAATGDEDDW